MAHKSRAVHPVPLEVGEHHHSQRSVRSEEHWEFIHEVTNGRLGSLLAVVDLRGKEVIRDLQLIAEESDFFRLGLKVLMPLIQENEIEHSDAPLNEFDFVLAAVANVLLVNLAVKTPGEQVIDRSALGKAFGPGVLLGVKLVPEGVGAVAPVGGGEGEELTRYEVTRMRRYDVEKPSFRFGIAESFECCEVGRRDVHSVRIPAVISRSSSTRRKREASSERA